MNLEQNLNIPPERRIAGSLTQMERIAPRLVHYGEQVADAELSRELAKLKAQIERTLQRAHVVAQAVQS